MNPYENLANAVVLQAVKDYRAAVVKLSHGKKNVVAEQTKSECEKFFRSPYFNVFTSFAGNALLLKLESEVEA